MQTAENTGVGKDRDPALFRLIRVIVKQIFPKYELVGTENLPDEPCVIVGNHAQMYGPIASELYPPRLHYIWCIGEVLNRKELPAYVMKDFWYMKPKAVRWLYRLFSHLIAGRSPICFYPFAIRSLSTTTRGSCPRSAGPWNC